MKVHWKNTSASAVFLLILSSASLLWSADHAHTAAGDSSTLFKADETLKKLMEGNQHFVSGQLSQRDLSARRTELVKGQAPNAVILSCSDSRVPPELIFDQGMGDLFVVRVSGNVVDPIALGSIEYAVERLHASLVIVMGHDKCDAVKATVDGGKPEGNIRAIVAKIAPAVKKAKAAGKKDDDLLEAAIIENVKGVMEGLTRDSKIIKHLVDNKEVKIIPAKYSLATGKVELLQQ